MLWRRTIGQGGKTFSIAAPRCTNAKFVWRKLFDHDPRFTVLSDKLAVRDFVRGLDIDVQLPKIFWFGTPDTFPSDFYTADVVIKSNHGWHTNLMPVRENLSRDDVDEGITRAYHQQHGRRTNEWAYYNITPRIFVEEIVSDEQSLCDLKAHVFGETVIRLAPNKKLKGGQRIRTHWVPDREGRFVPVSAPNVTTAESSDLVSLPATTHTALSIAREIGQYFDYLRVDFLATDNELLLGEVTVYSLSGTEAGGHATDILSNTHWDLRRSWFLNTRQCGWRAIYARALHRFCDRQAKKFPTLDASGAVPREKFIQSLQLAQSLERADATDTALSTRSTAVQTAAQ